MLALGKKLVEQLNTEGSADTLGEWMAHHIAALILRVEESTGDQKKAAERECFDAILALWTRNSDLPDGKRPFEPLEPILRAVESLDPEGEHPRYFRGARPNLRQARDEGQEEWLQVADELDYSAKVLVGYCLREAAAATLDKSQAWVKLASEIEAVDSRPTIILQFIATIADLKDDLGVPDVHAELRKILEDRIERLRNFLQIGETVANALEERLRALPTAKAPAKEDTLVFSASPRLRANLPDSKFDPDPTD